VKNGITRETLANETGLAVSLLSRYENNKILKSGIWTLEKIAKGLKTKLKDLLSVEPRNAFLKPNTLGGKIRTIRLQQHIRQNDLAKKIGISKISLCRYEKDLVKPKKKYLKKLASELKTTLKYLTSG